MAKKVLRKGKREWFNLIAPDVFKNKVLGEILSYTSKELLGRCIELSYSTITDNPRDRSKNFVVKITNVTESKATTTPVKIIYSLGTVIRILKRNKTNDLITLKAESKDKKKVTFKLYIISSKMVTRGVRTNLMRKIVDVITSKVAKLDAEQLFEPNYIENLGMDLKSQVKTIYPINGIAFWQVEVV